MSDRSPDNRSLNFAGEADEQGRPLSMTVEALEARAEKWLVTPQTPEA